MQKVLATQRDRWILWLAVGVIAGAAWWIGAPRDPPVWASSALMAAGAFSACLFAFWPSERRDGGGAHTRAALAGLCALAAAIGLGAAAAQVRTASVMEPAFRVRDAPVRVEGWVTTVEAGEAGMRVRLLVRALEGMERPPRYVRLAVPDAGLLTPGRAARCRAVLSAPARPIAPGGYDFARRAFFERLSASGFSYGRCRPESFPSPPGLLDRARLRLAALRFDLSTAIIEASPGRGGAIAAALVTGDRSAIDQTTNETLRDSGLGHLLSVSGIHMGVVGGLVFGALIWLLALIAPIALRWPVKKLAAAGALIVLGVYLIVSGSSVPALRAYVMAGVAFGAILLDRPAISMRGLALAALIVVLVFPESVLEPGFQMSFAATMALVALFEAWRRAPDDVTLPTPGPLIGSLQWSARMIGGTIGVSLVAGLATDPFALYHFQRFSTYALAANLIVSPIMSFLVAPAAGIAAVLAPFGWAEPALDVMAWSLDLVAAVGAVFGDRPEAVRALPRPPDSAFAACVAGLLWACLWRGPLRLGGAGFLALSIGLYLAAPRPVLAFDGETRAVFMRADQNWRHIGGGGRSTYARDRLGGMLGLTPLEIDRMAEPEGCGDALCMWRTPGGRGVVLVRRPEGFANACQSNSLMIASVQAPAHFAQTCKPAHMIDAAALAKEGGALIYEDATGLRIDRATPRTNQRPWTPRQNIAAQE